MDDLVGRAKRGDRAALESLVEAHLDAVYRFVAVKLRPGDPAVDDVVQETLVGAMTSVSRLRGEDEAAFVRWLLSIARFKIADHYRTAYARPADPLPDQPPKATAQIADPQDLAVERAASQRLRQALAQLTPDQEEVLVLKFVLGYDNEQVAAITQRPVGAVKSMQHRGLAALHRLLEGDELWT